MFHETLDAGIYEIIAAVVGATFSGITLLLIHHSKVKQELEIHRKKDIFERKQKKYRSFVNNLMAQMDLGVNPTHDFANWRIGNYLYNELLFIGSDAVIKAFNKYLKYDKTVDDDDEFTNITKDILIAIRKDLYGETLSRDEINFIRPTRDAYEAQQIIDKHYSLLKKQNLTNFKDFADVDVKKQSSETGIDEKELDFVKKSASTEIKIELDFNRFLDKEHDNSK